MKQTHESQPLSKKRRSLNVKEPKHTHGKNCGHKAVPHGSHSDYLSDGHIECLEMISVSEMEPANGNRKQ